MNKILTFLYIITFSHQSWAAMSANDIMNKNEEVRRLNDITANAMIITGGANTTERKKKFTWWRKLTSDKIHFNTLTRFHEPAEVRNEGILFLEHDLDNNDVLLYLPTYKKIRRVERNNQSGSFMGSELSYADIATPHADDYDFKSLRNEKCPSNQTDCEVIQAIPKRTDTIDRTGYSKSIQWIRLDNYMSEKIEHYNKDSILYKLIEASEIKLVDSKDNKWMAHKLKVTNQKTSKYTYLEFTNVKANTNISDRIFTQENLSNP